MGVLGFFGTALNAGINYFNNQQQRIQDTKNLKQQQWYDQYMAERKFENDIKMLDYMNEYNTPRAQKQRLIEAGLNPALMYNTMPQNVQTGNVQYPEVKSPNVDITAHKLPTLDLSVLQQTTDLRKKMAETDNLQVVNDLLREELGIKGEIFKAKSSDNLRRSRMNSPEALEYDMEVKKGSVAKLEAEIGKIDADTLKSKSATELQNAQKELMEKELLLLQYGLTKDSPWFMKLIRLKGDDFKKGVEQYLETESRKIKKQYRGNYKW
jgi:hypothetical protein